MREFQAGPVAVPPPSDFKRDYDQKLSAAKTDCPGSNGNDLPDLVATKRASMLL